MKNLFKIIWNWLIQFFTIEKISENPQPVKSLPIASTHKKEDSNPYNFKRPFRILNERPVGMNFEDYKNHLKAQKQWIKGRLKGFICYVSSEIIEREFDKNEKEIRQRLRIFPPFVGIASKLKPL